METRKDLNPKYKVFKDFFVLCWAGEENSNNNEKYYSRVDIELINEHVKLYYSTLDKVSISYDMTILLLLNMLNLDFKTNLNTIR